MNKVINQPNIRFKDSEGNWKACKIGDLLTEKFRPILIEDEKEYELVTVKRRNEGVVSRGRLKGKNILVKNYYEVEEDDFIISKRQIIHGASGIVPHSLHKAVVSNEYLVASSNENISSAYLTLISKLPQMHMIYFLSSYGVDVEKMVFDVRDWKKRSISIPDVKEQKRITLYFEEFDKLITLHQQKHEKLTALKEAMLDKMFPKRGQLVSEIRFAGFVDNWTEKRLGCISKITTGNSNREDSGEKGKYAFFDRSEDIRRSDIYLFDCEAIIVAGEGSDFKPKYFEGKFDLHQRTYAIMNFKDADGKYLFYYIYLFRKYFLGQAVGSTVKSLRLPMFENMSIRLPSKEEQKLIGNYLMNIDTLLSNHRMQIDKLKKIKMAFFERMTSV
jgi:type I restriction enzyme S subunit